ncbi:D-aminopeptidase DppA [Fodinicola feengrottensis]|uniref:D-aminopeptidase DppA n=3 Tax=Fodinicola feengrottensis TaxID=435914 RepID=A0ABN2FT43_9ACTN
MGLCRETEGGYVKVYVSADMEGVTGLVDFHDVQPTGRDYEAGRVMMTEDVNAAVSGALEGGATEVLVNDAHGPMRSLLPDRLHPVAELVRGKAKPMSMLEGLDAGFEAVLCIGFHTRSGALGVLSHSFMGHEIEDMWLDDRPVGEIGMVYATAAALGVPVILLSGDDAACAEMAEWNAKVATVPVKWAIDRFAAKLRPAVQAREAIRTGARDAVRRAKNKGGKVKPVPGTATLAVRWQSASVASHLLGIPGVTARDGRTIQTTAAMPDLFRQFALFMRIASTLTHQPPYC